MTRFVDLIRPCWARPILLPLQSSFNITRKRKMEANRSLSRCAREEAKCRKKNRKAEHSPAHWLMQWWRIFMKVIGRSSDPQVQTRGSSEVHRQLATKRLWLNLNTPTKPISSLNTQFEAQLLWHKLPLIHTSPFQLRTIRTTVYYGRVMPGTMCTFLPGDTQCLSRESGVAIRAGAGQKTSLLPRNDEGTFPGSDVMRSLIKVKLSSLHE